MPHRLSGMTGQLLAILILACVLRLGWIAANYTEDFSRFQNGDYTLYAIGGEQIRDYHDFSNSLFLVRPPLFPIMIAVLGLNTLAVLIANACIGALAAPLTVLFAHRVGVQSRWALIAGMLTAFDPPSVIYSAYLGAESLANTLLLISLLALIIGINARRSAVLWGIGGGAALVLASLARPASYLLWIPLSIGLIFFFRKQRLFTLAFMAVSALGCGLWIIHNAVVFDNPTFSTIGVYNLLYYRAASVEQFATDQDLDNVYTDLSTRVEERLGRDTSQVDAGTRHGHYAATAFLQDAMQAVAIDVFRAYPLVYLYTIPIGLVRTLILIETLPAWAQPIVWVWNGGLLLLALIGIEAGRRARNYRFVGLTILVCAYFIVGTVVVQTSGIDVRARTMLTPILAVAAAIALSRLLQGNYALKNHG